VTRIDGGGRTLMPGLIDAHTHIMFETLTQEAVLTADLAFVTAVADSADAVRQRAREQLALGASQLKLMAGGAVGSAYDPIDVSQYTVAELRAAVEAAENWGTYVTVHAYTPRAVRQAIEAGVRCIDHGHLLDDATAKLMADKGVWWSIQPFVDDGRSAFPEGWRSARSRSRCSMAPTRFTHWRRSTRSRTL
jgi:imidazolonepropionase-like amidohydrolase